MKNPKVAQRYAKALFDFAQEHNQLESVSQDIASLRETLAGNRELQAILNSPVIPPARKHTLFAAIYRDKIQNTTFIFLDIILRKKREPALISICEEFSQLYDRFRNIRTATLTTAQPINGQLVEQIREMLAQQTGSHIEIKQIVQPDIIGGIVIKLDDYYFDASIAARFNKLKQEFAHNVYQVNF